MANFKNKLLNYFNISEEDLLDLQKDVHISNLPDLSDFSNAKESLKIVKKHMTNQSKILIYGDYDCDGMMATSILKYTFDKLNYEQVGYYIPIRNKDGYGLNVEMVKCFIKNDYKLIICVDNGVSQIEAIALARENGIDVVICDHHDLPSTLPNTPFIIHPQLSKLNVLCSGGFTSLILSYGLLGYYDEYLVTLAGISTISDMMILKEQNRTIVKLTLELIKKHKYSTIVSLVPKFDESFDETTISNVLTPKINSIGRIVENSNINRIVKYFTSLEKPDVIRELSNYIDQVNLKRKEISNEFTFDASKSLSAVAHIEIIDVTEGLIGLIANRFLNEAKKPSIILSYNEKDKNILKGSARGGKNISIIDMLRSLDDLLIAYGGHDGAGGFSLYKKDLDKFCERVEHFILSNTKHELIDEEVIKITISDLNVENMDLLNSLSPFGMGWKNPSFIIKQVPKSLLSLSSNGEHLITTIEKGVKIISFFYNKNVFQSSNYVDLIGNIKYNYFNKTKSINFVVNEMTGG